MALPPSLGCFGAGARGPGSLGLAPVVATASFPLINLPKFYLSFTILVSLILVKYPDRVGLVNTVLAGTYGTYGTVPTVISKVQWDKPGSNSLILTAAPIRYPCKPDFALRSFAGAHFPFLQFD